APAALLLGALLPQHEVLVHRELGEDVAVLRHVADAQVGDLVGLAAGDVLALPAHLAAAFHHAHDGLGGGGAAGAVASQQGDDLALAHVELDAVQDMALAVPGVQVVRAQDHLSAPPPAGGRPTSPGRPPALSGWRAPSLA